MIKLFYFYFLKPSYILSSSSCRLKKEVTIWIRRIFAEVIWGGKYIRWKKWADKFECDLFYHSSHRCFLHGWYRALFCKIQIYVTKCIRWVKNRLKGCCLIKILMNFWNFLKFAENFKHFTYMDTHQAHMALDTLRRHWDSTCTNFPSNNNCHPSQSHTTNPSIRT